MPFVVSVGVSHHDAPVAVRERLAFQDRDLDVFYAQLRAAPGTVREAAVVSTCNRTELFAVPVGDTLPTNLDDRWLIQLLTRDRADPEVLPVQTRRAEQAVRHLCRVAAGLDSMVLGESEVLGQVSRAHQRAVASGASGPVLNAAFTVAVRAGRRARAETGIGRHAASVSSEAVRLVCELVPDHAARTVLIVGTGTVGRLAGESVRHAGAGRIIVVGRTTEHAHALAGTIGAESRPWHQLAASLIAADIVIASTGAPHAVLTAELFRAAVQVDPRQRIVVDVSVPRDVEPEAGALTGVTLFDIDAIQRRVDANHAARASAVPDAERIVDEEVARFEAWSRGVALRPVLSALHARGEALRRREVERTLHRLADRDPSIREEVERLSSALVHGLLDRPSRCLRDEADPERAADFAEAARELFGLDDATLARES